MISRQLKKERPNSECFLRIEVHDYSVLQLKFEPWWSLVRMAIIGDEDGGCARIAISPSFPNLLFAVCRSSNVSPPQDTISGLFFFRDNLDDEVFL